jgi:tetratricopeptide (TPR) repeat protein
MQPQTPLPDTSLPARNAVGVTPRTFRAFISYRHADNEAPGRRWASWLRQQLEEYEVPEELVGKLSPSGVTIPRKLYPIFRDEDEMPAGHDLSAGLRRALDNSEWLIVLCSPRTVASRWVNAEIRYFKERVRADRILALIVEGQPFASERGEAGPDGVAPELECFPEPLRYGAISPAGTLDWTARAEPRAADVRPGKRHMHGYTSAAAYRDALEAEGALSAEVIEEEVRVYEQQLASGVLQLIAGMLGLSLGELTQRDKVEQLRRAKHRARQLRKWLVAVSTLALLAIIGGGIAWWQKSVADERQRQVNHTRGSAESLINDMLFELRDKLEAQGETGLLDEVTNSAMRYFDGLPSPLVTIDTQKNAARALAIRAEVLLYKDDPAGLHATATRAFGEFERLIQLDPEDRDIRRRYIDLRTTVGALMHFDDERASEGDASLNEAVLQASRMAEKWPGDHAAEFLRLKTLILRAGIDLVGAGTQLSVVAALGVREPLNNEAVPELVKLMHEARKRMEPLKAELTKLAFAHPKETEYREFLAECCAYIGNGWFAEKNPEQAMRYLVAARRMYQDLLEDFPEEQVRRRAAMLASVMSQIGRVYGLRGNAIRSKMQLAESVRFFEVALERRDGFKEAALERQLLDTLLAAAAASNQALLRDDAKEILRKAREVAGRILQRNPNDENAQFRFVQCSFLDAMTGDQFDKREAASMARDLEMCLRMLEDLGKRGVAPAEIVKMKAEAEAMLERIERFHLRDSDAPNRAEKAPEPL